MSHSKGPWEIDADRPRYACAAGKLGFYVESGITGGRIAQVFENCTVDTLEEAHANARLIAAAPEMLKALKELVARCDGAEGVRADGSNIQTMQAHAAIAKAEGK